MQAFFVSEVGYAGGYLLGTQQRTKAVVIESWFHASCGEVGTDTFDPGRPRVLYASAVQPFSQTLTCELLLQRYLTLSS